MSNGEEIRLQQEAEGGNVPFPITEDEENIEEEVVENENEEETENEKVEI